MLNPAEINPLALPKGFSMRVIQTRWWAVDSLPCILAEAQKASSKSLDQICHESKITEDSWHRLIAGGNSTISITTLSRI
jgi:hypothetical protein